MLIGEKVSMTTLGVASRSRVDDFARAKDFHLVAIGILSALLDGDNR